LLLTLFTGSWDSTLQWIFLVCGLGDIVRSTTPETETYLEMCTASFHVKMHFRILSYAAAFTLEDLYVLVRGT
jgi:hypothetical protein